jgi:periplasmic protein TonB
MDDSLVYRKTRLGTAELAATHGTLSPPSRRVLILLDGARTVAELEELFGVEPVEHALSELEAQGYARRVDPEALNQATTVAIRTTTGATTTGTRGGLYRAADAGTHAGELDPEPSESRPRRGPLAWVLLLFATAAIGSGFWMFGRADRATNARADSPAVAADANGSQRPQTSIVTASQEEPGSPEPAQSFRELPLSGLPEVIVKATPAPAPAQPTARARRAAEPAASNETPPPDLPAASSAASSTPVVTTVDQTVASAPGAPTAAESRPQQQPVVALPTPASEAKAREAQTVAPQSAPVSAPPPIVLATSDSAQLLPRPPTPTPASAFPTAPASPPPTQIAKVAPPPVPASEPVALRARRHDPPEFPQRALHARVLEGRVLARIWVTAEGKVDQVDIVSATPARLFDDEVRRALSLWTFDPPGHSTSTTVELSFKP